MATVRIASIKPAAGARVGRAARVCVSSPAGRQLSAPAVRIARTSLKVSASAGQQEKAAESDKAIQDAVECKVLDNGAVICESVVPGNYIVSKVDKAETKGRGGMMLSWFLEGAETGSHCTVTEDGQLICVGLDAGMYEICEMPEEGSGAEHGTVVTIIDVAEDGKCEIKH
mmetsp:Transcript_16056/g.50479  ORF Transcript_16056/g.50479 Transcript_16056/m.50479 type:complete len:171 (+) Transcript_16056:200-712(+)